MIKQYYQVEHMSGSHRKVVIYDITDDKGSKIVFTEIYNTRNWESHSLRLREEIEKYNRIVYPSIHSWETVQL